MGRISSPTAANNQGLIGFSDSKRWFFGVQNPRHYLLLEAINRELQKYFLNPRNVWCNLDLFKKMGPKWSPFQKGLWSEVLKWPGILGRDLNPWPLKLYSFPLSILSTPRPELKFGPFATGPLKMPTPRGFLQPIFRRPIPIDGCSWLPYSGTRSPNLFTLPSFRFVENPKTFQLRSSSFGAWCFFLLQLSHVLQSATIDIATWSHDSYILQGMFDSGCIEHLSH